jgi:hypothetical protein
MQHRANQWQAEVDWTMQLREQLVSRIENETSSTLQPRRQANVAEE